MESQNTSIQEGGFFLSNTSRPKNFSNILNEYINKLKIGKNEHNKSLVEGQVHNFIEMANYRNITRPGGLTPENKNIFNLLINKLTDKSYTKVYNFFIKKIFDKKKYIQKHRLIKDGKRVKPKPIYPYTTNFMAMICISFILELELYTLTHLVITPNFFDNNRRDNDKVAFGNLLLSNFYALKENDPNYKYTNQYRIYRNFLSPYNLQGHPPNIDQIIGEFTKRIDLVFTKFMNLFIKNLSVQFNSSFNDIKKMIIDINSVNNTKDNENNENVNEYNHIYVDWKEYLIENFDNKISKKDINIIFKNTLNEFENEKTKYIAEGTGFFSFVFMKFVDPEYKKFPNIYQEQVHNGSCITYSLLESYIMTKLHFNGSHINLLLVLNKKYTNVQMWKYCRDGLIGSDISDRNLNFSHWATRLRFKTSDNMDFRMDKPYYAVAREINFVKSREEFIKMCLFPILDSYRSYLKINDEPITIKLDDYYGKTYEKDITSDIKNEYFSKIHVFINNRFKLISRLLKKKGVEYLESNMLSGSDRKFFTKKKQEFYLKEINKNIFSKNEKKILHKLDKKINQNILHQQIKELKDIKRNIKNQIKNNKKINKKSRKSRKSDMNRKNKNKITKKNKN
jgi:hypothetical protein